MQPAAEWRQKTQLYVARAEVRSRLTRSRRYRRLQIGRHQGKRLRLRLWVKHTVSHRARYKQCLSFDRALPLLGSLY